MALVHLQKVRLGWRGHSALQQQLLRCGGDKRDNQVSCLMGWRHRPLTCTGQRSPRHFRERPPCPSIRWSPSSSQGPWQKRRCQHFQQSLRRAPHNFPIKPRAEKPGSCHPLHRCRQMLRRALPSGCRLLSPGLVLGQLMLGLGNKRPQHTQQVPTVLIWSKRWKRSLRAKSNGLQGKVSRHRSPRSRQQTWTSRPGADHCAKFVGCQSQTLLMGAGGQKEPSAFAQGV